MRFCSKERMQEVVLKTVFKISEQEMSQSDLLRTATNLLNDLDKIFIFKCSEHNEKEELEKYNYESELKDNYFLAKLIRKSMVKERCEMIEHLIMQKLFSIYIYLSRQIYMRIQILQALNAAFMEGVKFPESDVYRHDNLRDIEKSNITLQHLVLHRHDLIKITQQRRYLIAVIRYYAVQQSIYLLHFNKEMQMRFFKGMSLLCRKQFIKGYFKLKEKEAIDICIINNEIQLILAKEAKQKSSQDNAIVKGYQLTTCKPNIEKLKKKVNEIEYKTLQKIKLLGTKTGHMEIYDKAEDERCQAILQDFENHQVIKKPLTKHLKLTIEQSQIICAELKSISDINQQMAQLEIELKRKESIDVTLTQQLLDTIEQFSTDILSREKALTEQFDVDDLEVTLNHLIPPI